MGTSSTAGGTPQSARSSLSGVAGSGGPRARAGLQPHTHTQTPPRGAKRPARGPQGALRVRVAKKPKQTEGAEAGDAGGGLLGLGGYGESGSES